MWSIQGHWLLRILNNNTNTTICAGASRAWGNAGQGWQEKWSQEKEKIKLKAGGEGW
jgi:hypothetical protein